MSLHSLFNSVVILITFYVSTVEVSAIKIGCESIKNCPLAKSILSKRYISAPPEVWSLFKISKCGYEKETNELKILCPKLKSCKTPTNEVGTCIPALSCANLALYLKINVTAELKVPLPLSDYMCDSYQGSGIHVCCPWPAKASQDEIVHAINFGETRNSRRKKRETNQPFFALNSNGNNFYDDGKNKYFSFGNDNFESEKPNFDFTDFGLHSKQNIFGQQNTNFFDYLKSGQMNTMNGLQNSLQKQTKWFQGSLQDQTKKITEAQHNFTNKLMNSWKGSTEKNGKDSYNLTEETFESAQEVCLTPDNFEGHCKLIRECSNFVTAINSANSTDVNQTGFLKKFRCGIVENNDIKICCPENLIVLPVTITTKAVQPRTENEDSTRHHLDSLSNICGVETIDDKIIGGTTTGLAEFPWTAVLYYSTPKGLTFACAGSIISNRYIVTAAHCVNSNILNQAGLQNLKQVVLGEYDRKNETDCIYTRYGSECADPPQSFGVDQIIEHALFKSNATSNDIALVRLDRNITFSDYIRPICLPTKGSRNLKENETITITGWGKTESGRPSQVKRKARLPYISKDNCGQLGPLAEGQMCLGSGNGTDSCRGDSGGPVMTHTIRTSNGAVSTLVGIISFGFGRCGTTTSVSTYVPHYLDWIFKNIP